jgi:predicted transglutaminase-like cysteine proteinase
VDVRTLAKFGALMLLAATLGGCATSGTAPVASIPSAPLSVLPPKATDLAMPAPAAPMPAAERTAVTPSGYVSFCLRFPDQCAATSDAPASVAMTPVLWAMLRKVNDSVNDAIWPEDDQRHYGRAEYWNIPTDGYGDCEDYALTKRRDLAAQGVSLAALRIAVVITEDGARHAVLTVVTDKGDYVLDNLKSEVLPWDKTGFTWLERQDPSKTMAWVSLSTADTMLADRSAGVVTGATP